MVSKRERGKVNMNGFNNGGYENNFNGYMQGNVQQGNVMYVINLAEILRAQTEGMIAAYNMGLQERGLDQPKTNSVQEPTNMVTPANIGYYAVSNSSRCGIFVNLERLREAKKYGDNWVERPFGNKQDAESYLRSEMAKINPVYASYLPEEFDMDWMYYAKNNFSRDFKF